MEGTNDHNRKGLAIRILSMLTIEVLTGLYMYFVSFGKPGAILIGFHATLGLVIVGPLIRFNRGHWRVTSSAAILASAILVLVSGLVLTWQVLFSEGTGFGWDLLHFFSIGVLIATSLTKLFAHRKPVLMSTGD